MPLSSTMSLFLLSYFLLSGPGTSVENKWDTCQTKKASGGRGRCLGRVSAYYLFSPEWCFSESVVLSLSPRGSVTSLWAEGSTRSISTQLSVAPSRLVYSFYCRHRWDSHGGTDRHTYTYTHTLRGEKKKHSAAGAIDRVTMATLCPASVSEHLYGISTHECMHTQQWNKHAHKNKHLCSHSWGFSSFWFTPRH